MHTPASIDGSPFNRREHRQVRAAAERRRSTAQRELNQLRRQIRGDLHTIRRQGETAAIVTRSKIAELGVRTLTRLAARLRDGR